MSFLGSCRGGAIVTEVTPRAIGYGGGAVTILGEGFSEDVFNQFDPILGNKVKKAPQSILSRNSEPKNNNGYCMHIA